MPDHGPDTDEATALVRWLLESGVRGLGLTKTHALQRATVREAAERWPHWWNHELFGPPHREAELPVLEATHAALRQMRLMRRQRQTLHTTARGHALLTDPDTLLATLHEDLCLGGDFEAAAWNLIEGVLHEYGPLPGEQLAQIVASLLRYEGWRESGGAPIDDRSLLGALQPLLWLAEGYGLVRRPPRGESLTLELTAAGRRLAAGPSSPAAATIPAVSGDTALGDHEVELTTPDMPDAGVATADVPIAELRLGIGQRIGYVFDFGDDWRVRLTVRERVAADAADHPRVLELRGTPPPQYAALDD
jgi:hypothetical protein